VTGSPSADGGEGNANQLRAELHQLHAQPSDNQHGGRLQRQEVVTCYDGSRPDPALAGLQLRRPVHEDTDPRY